MMPKSSWRISLISVARLSSFHLLPLYLTSAMLFIRILQYSWVTDDAFITFRSVMNFVAGDGPVFNVGERVQSFTHPLWFLMLSLGGWLDLNLYFFSIFLGLGFSLLTIIYLIRQSRRRDELNGWLGPVLGLGLLASSEAFVSFGTSGLENAATYFLITAAIVASLKPSQRVLFYFLVALALLNRLDSVFFLAPFLAYVTYADWKDGKLQLQAILVGFLPLILWHAFSLVYYGFLFPNTKYAKVGGRPFLENATFGIQYLADSAQAEAHVWFAVLFLSVLFILPNRIRLFSFRDHRLAALLLAGMYLQVAYVVLIAGGDFMRGRFLTIVTLGAATAMLNLRIGRSSKVGGALFALCASLFVTCAWIGAKEPLLWNASGVANERNFYKDTLGLNLAPDQNYTNHLWARQARELPVTGTSIVGVNGQRAYWTPRETRLVDPVALTDAFIARLPVANYSRTGHFQRSVPEEYFISRLDRRRIVDWKDKDAEELYDKIVLVTESKDLFTVERLNAMLWLWVRYGM